MEVERKMASGRVFERVSVYIWHEDGSRTNKYAEPVTLHLEYDPHGLSCRVKQGNIVLLQLKYHKVCLYPIVLSLKN